MTAISDRLHRGTTAALQALRAELATATAPAAEAGEQPATSGPAGVPLALFLAPPLKDGTGVLQRTQTGKPRDSRRRIQA